ncbi:MAG TPA: TSUP family transporter, partial [Polyangiales bacterium]|nr:TSUP family transporter [Polyangiales bacterium]
MPFADHAIIAGAGIVAGAINAVAGGGTLLTFPVLVALGRDPVLANATNALSLWPGSLAGAYALRREAWQARDLLFLLLPISVIGSFAGGVLLLQTPTRVFSGIVPFLVLGATLLLALQKQIARALPQAGDAA